MNHNYVSVNPLIMAMGLFEQGNAITKYHEDPMPENLLKLFIDVVKTIRV